jgi:hypothetical protein
MRRIKFRLILRAVCLAAVGAALALHDASAQAPAAKPEAPAKSPPSATTVPKAAAPAQPQVVMPDADKILLLVRSTLLTLNDALQTGNFTVLRDMGAPGFREANSAGRLAQIFAPLASQGVDLSAVSIIAPQLNQVPMIEPPNQMLRLKGFFPGQPLQINFEILYEPVAGRWRVFGLSVSTAPAQLAAPAPPPASAPVAKDAAATTKAK